jgi:hypothetical protein
MKNIKRKAASHHTVRESAKTSHSGIPLIVIYWAFGLGLLGYIGSRFFVSTHPLHWASGAAGLLLGIIIGYVWFLKRGDVGLI